MYLNNQAFWTVLSAMERSNSCGYSTLVEFDTHNEKILHHFVWDCLELQVL